MWVDFEAEAPKPKEAQQVFAYFQRKAKARFYADENFPERAIALLREMGAKVQTSRQAGLNRRSDEDQLAYALRNGLVVVTCDRDFLDERRHPLLYHPYRQTVGTLPSCCLRTLTLALPIGRLS